MNFTFHQLQVFLKVVQTKSITKAADELFLSQPAVSIQMKNLQDQFEIPLTEVIGRQLYVTDFGREISEMAEEIVNQISAINYKTLNYKGVLSGRLRLSVVSTGKYVMPYFLSGFLKQHPGIDLTMDVTNKNGVIQSLVNNTVDFALVSVLPDALKIETETLLENELYLVGNAESDLDKKENARSVFNKIPLIYREEGSGTRLVMESFFERSKMKVRKRLELTSNEAVKQAVIAGLGYSVMPIIGIRNELLDGDLKIIRVSGLPVKSSWQLIWLKNKKLSPLAEACLENIREQKELILKTHFSWVESSKVF
jgi:DNA-binding transcriptional LysR family regulator